MSEAALQEVVGPEPTLGELAKIANDAHASASAAAQTALDYAFRAGDALLSVREQLPHGEWESWVERNCTFARHTAGVYMRLARYQQLLPAHITTQREAQVYLRGVMPSTNSASALSDEIRDEGLRLLRSGMRKNDVAEALGVSRWTVQRWAGGKKGLDRERRKAAVRARRARAALRRDERAKEIKAKGGSAAEAYSLIRKAAQELDRAHADASDSAARQALSDAQRGLHKVEDDIALALKVSA